MPTPRKYETTAQKQAAYRQRQQQMSQEQRKEKSLPALPAIAAMPGTARWRQTLRSIETMVVLLHDEMQEYADQRSDAWRETERGEQMQSNLQTLEEIRDHLQNLQI